MRARTGPVQFVRGLLQILRGKPQVPPSLEDNQALRVVLDRRSVRRFSTAEIPDDVMAAILEAGRLAPSTVNLQTWSFALFSPATWKTTFGRALPFGGARAVVVLADSHRVRLALDSFPHSPLVEHTVAVMNASLAAMNMNIAAEALGVASVMLSETGQTGILDAGYLAERLGLPPGVVPLMTIVLGYPRGGRPPMPPKLPLDQVCFQGPYPEPAPGLMDDWLAQMKAGYRASHPLSSFDAQLRVYEQKLARAEAVLQAMLRAGRDPGS